MRLAKQQLDWIDVHGSDSKHSTLSAARRGQTRIFANLVRQAGMAARISTLARKTSSLHEPVTKMRDVE